MRVSAGLALFGLIAIFSAFSFDDFDFSFEWAVVVACLAGLSIVVNAWEYQVAARASSRNPAIGEAARIAVAGSAANLLPVPGAILARVRGLTGEGVTMSVALKSNILIGLTWVSVAAAMAAIALLTAGRDIAAGATLLVSIVVMGAAAISVRGLHRGSLQRAVVVEVVFVVLSTARFFAAARAIGLDSTLLQSMVAPLGAAGAAAAGILPGGLGLRELLTGLLGAGVGLSASGSAFAASFDRLVGIAWVAMVAISMGVFQFDSNSGAQS